METHTIKKLLSDIIFKLPEFRVYRRENLLVRKDNLEIMFQFVRHKHEYSCILYFYIDNGKKIAFSPIFFMGDYDTVIKTIDILTPSTKATSAEEAFLLCKKILTENEDSFMIVKSR